MEIKWFCGVKREAVDDKYSEELNELNKWYWKATGDAYTNSCVKEFKARKKKNRDEEIDKIQDKIQDEYNDELHEIYIEYIARESEMYNKYLERQKTAK